MMTMFKDSLNPWEFDRRLPGAGVSLMPPFFFFAGGFLSDKLLLSRFLQANEGAGDPA